MTNILEQYKNIIDFSKYKAESIKVAEPEKRLPLIYALHSPGGEPLILFRFVTEEQETPKVRQAAPVFSFAHYHNQKKVGA